MHQRIAARLEAAYGASAAEHAAELARHFRFGREPIKAVAYLRLAASQAGARGAHREAASYLTQALELIQGRTDIVDRDRLEMTLYAGLGPALLATYGFGHPEVVRVVTRALELAEELGDKEAALSALFALTALLEYRSQHGLAEEMLQRIEPQKIAAAELRLPYHALLACVHFHHGEFGLSLEQGRNGLPLMDAKRSDPRFAYLGEEPAVGCSEWTAQAMWFLGYPDEAVRNIEYACATAEQPNRRFSLASTRSHAARIHQLRREPALAASHAVATAALADEQGYAYHRAVALILTGWATGVLGDLEGGIAQVRRGIEAHRQTGAAMDRPYFEALLAELLLARGAHDEALELLGGAIAQLPKDRSYFYEAELHRLRGEALAASSQPGAPAEAEAELRKALSIAHKQEARGLELRAVTSLARLTMRRDPSEARSLLEPVYDWFSEGLDTADLVEARELLDALARPA